MLAQMVRAWSMGEMAVAVVVVVAVVALVVVFIRQSGVPIPGWLVQVFWILVAAIVVIAAIRFLLTM